MSKAELLLEDFDVEISNTRRTLQRVPEGIHDWAPHAKSTAIGRLAMHCAGLPMFGYYVMEDAGMDMANSSRPHIPLVFTTRAACLELLEESAAKCRAALDAASDEALGARWEFRFGEHLISNVSRSLSYRILCLNHLIHHTSQLGVYLKLNDLPVPACYGPSADEQWTLVQ
jgi:uncharacterized damage-inducible protein DinB